MTGREMRYAVRRLPVRRIRDAMVGAWRQNPRFGRVCDEERDMDMALEIAKRTIGLHSDDEQAILNWIRSQKNGGRRI